MLSPLPPGSSLGDAGQAFRCFFDELRGAFYEREGVFTQLELALLSREHLLIMGPPGTGKSALAQAVLGRIVDAQTGLPSLFARQLTESTVQTDLLGPVNFKVLTESGRTEYLTAEGILGSTHALLDEVFDGRDMLLRSVLNALEERELKAGARMSLGELGSAVLTSNRYLSEAVSRAPELLVAVADRLAFTAFVPKAFSRSASPAALLTRAAERQRPRLTAPLTLQQLRLLQDAVARVEVSAEVLEGVQALTQGLERILTTEMTRSPSYVPTRSFSPRTLVKAVWVLKAVVVRESLLSGRPPRAAKPDDLGELRHFYTLGGPVAADLEELMRGVVDPRERVQLEALLLEQRAFDEALGAAQTRVQTGLDVERMALKATEDFAAAEALGRSYQPGLAVSLARALRDKLIPGPRHPTNREAVLAGARALCAAAQNRAVRGVAGQGEGRTGAGLWSSFGEIIQLMRDVPELRPLRDSLRPGLLELSYQGLEVLALSAQALAFEGGVRLEAVAGQARQIELELRELNQVWQGLGDPKDPTFCALLQLQDETRLRVVQIFQEQADRLFQEGVPPGPHLTARAGESRRLRALEEALIQIHPSARGLTTRLLTPLARGHVQHVLSTTLFSRTEQYLQALQSLTETLRRESIMPGPLLASGQETMAARLADHVRRLSTLQTVLAEDVPGPNTGDAYFAYRERFSQSATEGEASGLRRLQLKLDEEGADFVLPVELFESLARAELALHAARLAFLKKWVDALGAPSFDVLVRSRLPMLILREGELVRLRGSLQTLGEAPSSASADRKAEVAPHLQAISELASTFRSLSEHALSAPSSAV